MEDRQLRELVFLSVQKATLGSGGRGAGSESDVRHWHRGFGSAVGTGIPWCFPVSEAAAKAVSCRLQGLYDERLKTMKLTFLLQGSAAGGVAP